MPLTKQGKQILRNFQKEYGAKRGREVFYAWLNKNPEYKKIMER